MEAEWLRLVADEGLTGIYTIMEVSEPPSEDEGESQDSSSTTSSTTRGLSPDQEDLDSLDSLVSTQSCHVVSHQTGYNLTFLLI